MYGNSDKQKSSLDFVQSIVDGDMIQNNRNNLRGQTLLGYKMQVNELG
jgi:hypothetical protein